MTLELAYWLSLGVGLGLLVLSLLIDDLLEILPFDFPGSDFAAGPVFFTAAAAFGAGGLLGLQVFDLGTTSIFAGLGAAVGIGALTGFFFVALKRQESIDTFERTKLVGMRGRATLAIGPGKTGRITVQYAGMTRSLAATSDEEIKAGEEVVVRDVIGNSLTVARPDSLTSAEQP